MMRPFLLFIALHFSQVALGQLQVHRPVNLGSGEPGENLHCEARRCGVVTQMQNPGPETQLYFLNAVAYSIEGFAFTPSVTCLEGTEGQCTRWGIGGTLTIPKDTSPGVYQGTVSLSVEGPAWSFRQDIPLTARVTAPVSYCILSGEHSLNLGTGLAGESGQIQLDPIRGLYSTTGGQRKAPPSTYHRTELRIITSEHHVLVDLSAPNALQGNTGTVGFTSLLAAHRELSLTGSGSVILRPDKKGQLPLLLGGRVEVTSSTTPGRYRGTIHIRYHCY